MKKELISSLLFLAPSFLLSALQGNLYFSPISLPMFWCIFLTYYSFKKSLPQSLLLNIAHCFIIASYTTASLSQLILTMNGFSLVCYALRSRFNTGTIHMTLTSGAITLIFFISQWLLQVTSDSLYLPRLLGWIGTALVTTLVAPFFMHLLSAIESKIQAEKVETLQNLRV